jgi:membrane fusion protein (multidrug efflux system)
LLTRWREGYSLEEYDEEPPKIWVTGPMAIDVTVTQRYVCQIRSQRQIELCALEGGYLADIKVREGEAVKKGGVMFRIVPALYATKLNAEKAEAELAQQEFDNTDQLVAVHESRVTSV